MRPVDVVVFGLGRLGSSALEAVEQEFPDRVLGVDVSPRAVAAMQAHGHNVVLGDATDPEFWSRTEDLVHGLDWVLLTMASHEANLAAVERLRARGFTGRIVATSRYPDQADELRRTRSRPRVRRVRRRRAPGSPATCTAASSRSATTHRPEPAHAPRTGPGARTQARTASTAAPTAAATGPTAAPRGRSRPLRPRRRQPAGAGGPAPGPTRVHPPGRNRGCRPDLGRAAPRTAPRPGSSGPDVDQRDRTGGRPPSARRR